MVGICHYCDKTLELSHVLFTSRYDAVGFFINLTFWSLEVAVLFYICSRIFGCLGKYWAMVICQGFKAQAYRLPQDSFDLYQSFTALWKVLEGLVSQG